ncbi:glycosyltransferase family 2 protein [Rhodanobacter ginsengiterrae]|uniref:glycosyltransferase family 2 protein n=1 Tax=Rhodanobacter ginsengiterrae TaxID=2008451 RepID=UPI003CF00767
MSSAADMRRSALRRWSGLRQMLGRWRRAYGGVIELQPADQLTALAGAPGMWRADGNDPKFHCDLGGRVLRAGWYRLSIELEDIEAGMLEPVLYFDHGNGMHEAWSLHLNFVRPGATAHEGVVLLTQDVHGLRFDPTSAPCTFRLGRFVLSRIGRPGATWRMWRQVARTRASLGASQQVLRREAWAKLRSSGGLHAFGSWLHGQYTRRNSYAPTYERWLRLYEPALPVRAATIGEHLVSILLPVYNTPERWLRRCLDSVLAQSCGQWELCVADDASIEPHVRTVLEEYAGREPRMSLCLREHNGHISAASNSALAMARGDFVALLDHDDELHPHAVAHIVESLREHPQWQLIYTDEDKIDAEGRRYDPYFKPDWDPDLLCGQNCISHLGIYSRALVVALGGFRQGLEGSQDWDLALRCSEHLQANQIGHIPAVLYHWRAVAGSTALAADQKGYAHHAGLRALREHFARRNEAAEVCEIDGLPGLFRVRHPLAAPLPRISIVIPTRDRVDLLRRCVESIVDRSTYPDYEIVVVDNQSSEPDSLTYLAALAERPRVRVLRYDQPFNYSAINNQAVLECSSELICLLNNDIEVISPGWLEELASHAMRPQVGAVGAMLYYPNETIQHAGVMTGVHGVAAHPYCGMPRGHAGQMARARLVQQMSAVTAACLMVRRAAYQQVEGLDPSLQVAFNDVDFCLRLRQQGYRNVWTPFAELYHHESASRGHEDTPEKRRRFSREVSFMKHRWGSQLERDPAYNPNLTLSGEPFTLAFPPREWRQDAVRSMVADFDSLVPSPPARLGVH